MFGVSAHARKRTTKATMRHFKKTFLSHRSETSEPKVVARERDRKKENLFSDTKKWKINFRWHDVHDVVDDVDDDDVAGGDDNDDNVDVDNETSEELDESALSNFHFIQQLFAIFCAIDICVSGLSSLDQVTSAWQNRMLTTWLLAWYLAVTSFRVALSKYQLHTITLNFLEKNCQKVQASRAEVHGARISADLDVSQTRAFWLKSRNGS